MAPKKKGAKKETQALELGSPSVPEQQSAPAHGASMEISHFNAPWLTTMPTLIRKIQERMGDDFHTQAPLTMEQGALQPPFVEADYRRAIGTGMQCSFGGNFFWQDMSIDSLIAHIPIKTSRVYKLAESRFAQPVPLPAVTVAVNSSFNPLENKGKCRRISPSEPVFACLVAIARDVDSSNDERIDAWKKFLLSTSFTFRTIENNDDFVFTHMQMREDAAIDFELVRMSSLARMVDTVVYYDRTFRERGIRLSAAGLAQEYGRLKLAESSEQITESWVSLTLIIHNKLMVRSPDVFTMLLKLDDELGVNNPLDSITKIHLLLGKCKERIAWGFELLVDLLNNGGLAAKDCSVVSLKGTGSANVAKGLGDVFYIKYDILQFLLEWINDQKIDTHIKQKLRDISINVKSFRDHCGCTWNRSSARVDKAWKTGWPDAANHMVGLLETLVFSTTYDDIILQNVKNKKSVGNLLEVSPLDELVTEITEALHEVQPKQDEEPAQNFKDDGVEEDEAPMSKCEENNNIKADPTAAAVLPHLDDVGVRKLERFRVMAQELVASNVTLVHELMSESDQLEALKKSPAGSERGNKDALSHVLIWCPTGATSSVGYCTYHASGWESFRTSRSIRYMHQQQQHQHQQQQRQQQQQAEQHQQRQQHQQQQQQQQQ